MEEKDFNGKVTVNVSSLILQSIYKRLDDEAIPHAIRVSKCQNNIRRITIFCDPANINYFIKKILKD